jgi:hypothetical protein
MSFGLNEFGPEHCNNRSQVGTPVALVTVGLIMRGQSAVLWHPSHAASRLLLMVRSYLAKRPSGQDCHRNGWLFAALHMSANGTKLPSKDVRPMSAVGGKAEEMCSL